LRYVLKNLYCPKLGILFSTPVEHKEQKSAVR
jgi:hypothetical protein